MIWIFQLTASLGSGLIAACLLGYFWAPRPLPIPTQGERGLRRASVLAAGGWVRRIDATVRHVAARVADWRLGSMKAGLSDWLSRAGWPFGWDADEFIAGAMLASGAGAILGGALGAAMDQGTAGSLLGAVAGVVALRSRSREVGRRRHVIASRNLPGAIELIALAMRAGLDFTGALTRVSEGMSLSDPLRFELDHVLHKLSLGWSRRDALESLATRLPDEAVTSFVGAVTQADRRGNPLAEVLSTQAGVMRLRRSQAAEESAARAGVLILGPLMLIFLCVFLILLGPFLVRALRGEIF